MNDFILKVFFSKLQPLGVNYCILSVFLFQHIMCNHCIILFVSCRLTGGHVGRARQLQHHSERAEAFLQQTAGGERPVGESQSCHGDLSWSSGTSMRNVLATLQLLPSHRPMPSSQGQDKSCETRPLLCSGFLDPEQHYITVVH